MIENKFKRAVSAEEKAFFMGADWDKYAVPFLNDLLESVKEHAVEQTDDEKELFRLQGEARRLRLLLKIAGTFRQEQSANKEK
jgi:hypothetical protein